MRISFLIVCLMLTSEIYSQKKLNVVASASMISDIASNILGDQHDIYTIVPIGGDPHLHEPTPSNARMVASADLILINGLTFEGWINELIDNSGTEAMTVIVSDGVEVLRSQTYQNSADPHAWMDASNGIIYASNILEAISNLDTANIDFYRKNFEKYAQELQALDDRIKRSIQSIPSKQRILITSHDAFQYYGLKYGIQLEAIMGISTEAEAQTSDIVRVNRVIREQKVPAIFVESTINPKLMEQLARDNDVAIGGSLYADSLGDIDSPASTYTDMLEYNTMTIVKALTGTTQAKTSIQPAKINVSFLIGLGLVLFLGLGLMIWYMNKKDG